jgi:hypothetical protein
MEKIDFVLPWGVAITSGNKNTWVECKIDEDRYKVSEGYKITLISLDERFTYEHYYQSDFRGLIESGYILFKNKDSDHIEYIKWLEPLTETCSVVHEADVVMS